MAQWRLKRVTDGHLETGLFGGTLVDAYNRFARTATVEFSADGGDARSRYPPFTPVELEVDGGSGWQRQFGGFVAQPQTEDGTVVLDVLAHDLWLRRREVYEAYSSVTVDAIIQDLVTNYTPLVWDASLVEVVENATVSREWKGERVANILEELTRISGGEQFGATDDAEFFFQPAGTTSSPRDFTPGGYFSADFEEDGTDEVNKVTVYYGEGSSTGAVSVQDRASQTALQDELGTPRPVVIEETASHPEISSESAAERKARAILNGGTTIRTGEVEAWDALAVEPGDVARVRVPDQDVDGDYAVAELAYDLGGGPADVQLAQNKEGVTDVLVDLSSEVSRVDAKSADASVSPLEVIALGQDVVVETEVEVFTQSVPEDQFSFGSFHGGFGHPDVGGGRLGNQRGDKTKVE